MEWLQSWHINAVNMMLIPDLRWSGESSVPASSPWWLEKHLSGYYTLLFFPSSVSACSLSLHAIKTTSLAPGQWARHWKQSLVWYPSCDPQPPIPILVNEMVLFYTSKRGLLFTLAFYFADISPSSFTLSHEHGQLEYFFDWKAMITIPQCPGYTFSFQT